VARALVSLTVPPGTDVIREGDPGDRFYVIADGEVDVSAGGKPVTTLRRGDYFGEIALLCDVARTATVTARTDTRLYALEREHFLAAVTGHSRVQLGATALATQRLDELRTLREADARAEEALATIPTPP
jgi:CRP-like cAMP-binding protein